MNGFDDIQDLLADILDETKPLPSNVTAAAHKAGKAATKAPMPKEAVAAVTAVAVETFDAELLEIAAAEGALSSAQGKKAARAVQDKSFADFAKRAEDPTPIAQSEFDSIHATMDAARSLLEATEEPPVMADLPPELTPSPEEAFADPEAAADAVAPALRKVTQGVTGDALDVEGAMADVKGAIFADTQEREREEAAEALRIPMPQFVGADLKETMDLRNFATLVTLNTARWHAKVKDRKAAKDVAAANNSVEEAYETRKRLLVGADEKLKAIHKAIDTARAKHYEMTLPWTTRGVDDAGRRTGARLLPNTLFFEYTKVMHECLSEMKAALDSFVPDYPALIEIAKKKLGKSFDPGEYPNTSSIRGHFDLSFDFQPIPEGKDFSGLPKQQLDALATSINRKSEQMMENAMQDVWARLYKAVTHMHGRLASPDKTFHYTMTDNIRETTRLMKHLNVTGNQDIERIRMYLDKFICPHDAKELRDNSVLRMQVAAHVQNVIDKMRKIGGAP
jgi:hypothetical protein